MKKKPRTHLTIQPVQRDILEQLSNKEMLISALLSGASTKQFYREARQRARDRYNYKRSLTRLEQRGLIRQSNDVFCLTVEGRELLEVLAVQEVVDRTWKGRWWLVMYDIPVSMTPFRFEIRRILVRAGFRKLQQSVWIHWHRCSELEGYLRKNSQLQNLIRYVETLPFPHMESLEDWKKLTT